MDKNDMKKMLAAIAVTAQEAADEAKEKMHSASQTLSDKYDEAKLHLAFSRTKTEQERIFTDMGRILFLMDTGSAEAEDGSASPKQILSHLMVAAEQKQQELDRIRERLEKISTGKHCPVCGKRCEDDDKYCHACGAKL